MNKPTAKQKEVLRYFRRKKRPSYAAIATELGTSKTNVANRVAALRKKGLI